MRSAYYKARIEAMLADMISCMVSNEYKIKCIAALEGALNKHCHLFIIRGREELLYNRIMASIQDPVVLALEEDLQQQTGDSDDL